MPDLYKRLFKTFADVIVLKKLEKRNFTCAYSVIYFIRDRFHVPVSSGTVYAILYALERRGLIEGLFLSRKRVYRLTEKGKETLENISKSSEDIVLLLKSILEK